jgi:pyrimidine-specific ribonucleoside hydrolase
VAPVRLARALVCAVLGALLAHPARAEPRTPRAIWIDSDAACGSGGTRDVDDCLALVQAFRSPELAIRGISTLYGNADADTTFATARALCRRLEQAGETTPVTVHPGAAAPGAAAATPATRALAAALRRESLTIVALGPLTNVASLLRHYPESPAHIASVIAVAGTRPGKRRLYPGSSRLLHLHDANFLSDPDAFDVLLRSGVPLTLVPFEVGRRVTIDRADLARLASTDPTARWLAEASEGWLRFWQRWLRSPGFHPFDSLAIGYVARPSRFSCDEMWARVRRPRSLLGKRAALEVAGSRSGASRVRYCFDLDPGFETELLERLTQGARPRAPLDARLPIADDRRVTTLRLEHARAAGE